MRASDPDERLSLPRLLAFAAPAGSVGAIFLPMTVFLPAMYAELGIELATVGIVFLIAKVWDGVTDPVLGVLADRFGGRWGRRRPWIVASVPILALSIHQIFSPPAEPGVMHLLGWLLVLYVGWTMLTISHVAWASELSEDYDERSRIMGAVQVLSLLGGLSVLVFAASLETDPASGALPDRVARMGLFILLPLPFLVALATATRREAPRARQVPLPWGQAITTLFVHRSLRRLITADLLIGVQIGTAASLHVFFVSQVLELPDSASVYLVVMMLAGLASIPLWVKLSYRLGKHRTLCAGAALGCVAATLVALLPSARFGLGLVAFAAMGLYSGARELLMRSMMADVVLEDSALREAAAGGERAGTFFAMLTFTAKLGVALAVGISFVALSAIGFDAEAANGPDTLMRFRLLMASVPILAGLGVITALWRFPIDARKQRELRTEIEARRTAPPATT